MVTFDLASLVSHMPYAAKSCNMNLTIFHSFVESYAIDISPKHTIQSDHCSYEIKINHLGTYILSPLQKEPRRSNQLLLKFK